MQKNFLSITDLSREEIIDILDTAATQKHQVNSELLKHKNIALLFEKQSLRTKASFETGIHELGANTSYFSETECGRLGERESIKDHAKVLSSYFDAIVARVYEHKALEKLAAAATVPVINALSDKEHPCQILADLLTIREKLGTLEGIKLVFLGDGNNVALSMALAAEILGFEFVLVGPEKYFLEYDQVKQTEDLDAALTSADVVYSDTWISMGNETETAEREAAFLPYQLNADTLKKANLEALVMHCLPAHRGLEITADVIDGPQSVVFEQAANRLPVQKALLVKIFMGEARKAVSGTTINPNLG